MNDNSTYPAQMRHPGGVLRRSGEASPRPLAPGPNPWPPPGSRIALNSGAFTEAPQSSISAATPVTHLAKKPLQMRHKISDHRRNPLKERHLQRHE
jgi:hypothetical protein